MKIFSSRATALEVLSEVFSKQQSLTHCLAHHVQQVDVKDKRFIQQLCYGVLRYYPCLDAMLSQLMAKPLKAKDLDIRIILYLGLYQLQYLATPEHAAVAETTKLCSVIKKKWATKLVNGVLRQFIRQQQTILDNIQDNDVAYYAHPQWLIESIKAAWPGHWQAILNANNQQAPMTLRVNRQQQLSADYLSQLQEANITAHQCQYSHMGIELAKAVPVAQLPDFAAGAASVQDQASQLVTPLMELDTHMRVLDACAAPGGKACHMLESEQDLVLHALDHDAQRLEKVAENLQRLNVSAQLLQGDAGEPETWWDSEPYDRILLDAPCSATGVIRRHPDIKYLRQSEDIATLASTQLQLLTQLWPLLKPGGLLMYTTCSIFPEENQQIIAAFLAEYTDAQEQIIEAAWGHSQTHGRQILPGEENMDGFYFAKLVKAN